MTWLWQKIKALFGWAASFLWGFVKSILEGSLKRKLVALTGTLVTGWLSMLLFGPPEIASAVNPIPTNYVTQRELDELLRKHVGDAVRQTRLEVQKEITAKEFQRRVDSIDNASMREAIRLLVKQNNKLLSLTEGRGEGRVRGGGEVKDSAFKDLWLDARWNKFGAKLVFNYDFLFDFEDAVASFEQVDGKLVEIHSVQMRSKVNREAVIPISNYTSERLMESPKEPKDDRAWYWGDMSLNADFVFTEKFCGGLSMSFFTWTEGGLNPEAVIMRLPDVGLATNFNDALYLFAGVRYNVGRHVPIASDLFIAPAFGLGKNGTTILIRIGTTL